MKRNSIQKQLKKDLSVASNSDFSSLMEKCENGGYEAECVTTNGNTIRRSRSKFIYYALGLFILIAILACVIHISQSGKDKGMGGYFVIDINPSIKICYDKEGIVTEVVALNEDADVLLCDIDLTGKSPEAVVDALFERCISLGYFSADRENNAVLASATSDNGESDDKMTERLEKTFKDKFSSKKILGVVITGIQDSALDEEADKHGIDSQKYALILHYTELGGELDESLYDEISISELYTKISELEKQIKAQLIEKAKEERSSAERELFASLASDVLKLIDGIEKCITRIDSVPSAPDHETGGGKPGKPEGAKPPRHDKGHYDSLLGDLMQFGIVLESAKKESDITSAVDGILAILNKIKNDEDDEELIALVSETIDGINELLENVELKKAELDELDKTIQEQSQQRLDAFKDSAIGKNENVEDWQRDKEQELMSNWYSQKREWQNERKNDLAKPKK